MPGRQSQAHRSAVRQHIVQQRPVDGKRFDALKGGALHLQVAAPPKHRLLLLFMDTLKSLL